MLEISTEDVSDVAWESVTRRLVGADFDVTEIQEIQACGDGGCITGACTDDCFHWGI